MVLVVDNAEYFDMMEKQPKHEEDGSYQSSEQQPQRHHHDGSRSGRKGDPRMHKAVQARLADPNLRLFEALQIGGFDYPNDNDAGYMDSEQVTLGQRKNQLSRRVRLAKKLGLSSRTKHDLLDDELSCEGDENSAAEQRPKTMMAKYHPDYHPIFPRVGGESAASSATCKYAGSNPVQKVRITKMGLLQHQHQQALQQRGAVPPALSSAQLASGVAVASLSQTASSIGLTLEQLAVALQTHSTLAQVLNSGPTHFKTPKDLALAFYQSECRALYQKAMLKAGFSPEEAKEGTTTHTEFAFEACQAEEERLRKILNHKHPLVAKSPILTRTFVATPAPQIFSASARKMSPHQNGLQRQQHQQANQEQSSPEEESCTEASTERHSYNRENASQQATETSSGGIRDSGRHTQRLEGKCGRKAVLHKPRDGTAHVDFVVGDKVYCYQGIDSFALNSSANGVSGYPCVSTDSYCAELAKKRSDGIQTPLELSLDDIDMDSEEWNAYFGETMIA